MSTRKIVTNTLYYGVVPKLTMLLSIVILPLTTPFLTTYDYGIYGVMTSYTSLFVSIAPLGLHVHLTNSFFEYPRHYHLVWGRVLAMVLVSSLVFGLLNMGILMWTLPSQEGLGLPLLTLVGSVPIFLLANGLLAQHLFPLVERPKPLVFTNLTGSVLGMLVSFVLIYYFRQGYWGLISSGFVSAIFVFTVFIQFVWKDYQIRPIWDHNRKRMVKMIKIALPLVPHTLGGLCAVDEFGADRDEPMWGGLRRYRSVQPWQYDGRLCRRGVVGPGLSVSASDPAHVQEPGFRGLQEVVFPLSGSGVSGDVRDLRVDARDLRSADQEREAGAVV